VRSPGRPPSPALSHPARLGGRLFRAAIFAAAAAACGTQAATTAPAGGAPPPENGGSHAAQASAARGASGAREISAGLPDPQRVVWVSPSGGGNGATAERPRKLQAAVDAAKAGDEIRLVGGDYEGRIRVSTGGSPEHPIVIRNKPGDAVRLKGWIHVDDGVPSVWIVGLEITLPHPDAGKGDPCIQMQGADVRAINNYVHDCAQNGITAWRANRSASPGQMAYGNVIVRSDHGVYAQNRYDEDGYKKFVRNLILESGAGCERNSFSFHGNTESGWNSGLWVEDSVVRGARFIVGGTNGRTRHTVVKGNVFYKASPQLAYTTPAQHDDVSGNVVYGSQLTIGFWATDGPSRFTNNELMNPAPGAEINDLRPVSKPAEAKGKPVSSNFNPQDVIDGNTYLAAEGAPIRSTWWMTENKRSCCCKEKTLAQLRADLQASGCMGCEANAKTIAAPVSPRVFLWDNAYEKGRGELAIFRDAGAGGASGPVPVDLSRVVAPGAAFAIVKAADGPAGTPVVAGTYSGGTVAVPLEGEFEAFLVLPASATPTGATPDGSRQATPARSRPK